MTDLNCLSLDKSVMYLHNKSSQCPNLYVHTDRLLDRTCVVRIMSLLYHFGGHFPGFNLWSVVMD